MRSIKARVESNSERMTLPPVYNTFREVPHLLLVSFTGRGVSMA